MNLGIVWVYVLELVDNSYGLFILFFKLKKSF